MSMKLRNKIGFISLSMIDGEEKLIARAIRGESSAFGTLYDHYQPKIYRFVVLRVGRSEEAEDITHHVFLNAWLHIRTYENLGFPFSSWLYRIARNSVIDHYRTKREHVSIDAIDPDVVAHPDDLEARTDRAIEGALVRAALATLKEEHQEVIIMRFVEELSIKEVAAAVEKTEGAIKLLQHRAIKELKKKLGERTKAKK